MGETQMKETLEILENMSAPELEKIYQLVKKLHDNPVKEKPRNYRKISAMLTHIKGDFANTVIQQRNAAL